MDGLTREPKYLITNQEYLPIDRCNYAVSYRLARYCEVLKEWHIPIINRYLVKYNDIATGNKILYELHSSSIEELQELTRLDYVLCKHDTKKGYIVASVARAVVQIPHVIIFKNIDEYKHWVNGIIISLISNDRIRIPLFDDSLNSDIMNDIIEMMNSDDERDNYYRLIDEWNEMFPELQVLHPHMPVYDISTMGVLDFKIAPPGDLELQI